ncbi:MAG: hypothetical protein KBS70_07350 [Bacteroidales bacterium]|nr:hypothetical protein [Candidatus Colicola equi]
MCIIKSEDIYMKDQHINMQIVKMIEMMIDYQSLSTNYPEQPLYEIINNQLTTLVKLLYIIKEENNEHTF